MFNADDDNRGVNLVVLYKAMHDEVYVTHKKKWEEGHKVYNWPFDL